MKGFNFRYFNLTKKEEEKKPHTTHTMKKSRSMMTDFLKHWPLSPGADVAQHSESMFLLQLKASFAAVCIWYWGETVQNTYQRTARQFPSIYYNQNPTNVGFLRTIPRAISNDLKKKKEKRKNMQDINWHFIFPFRHTKHKHICQTFVIEVTYESLIWYDKM